jgi:sporadic carbohydrate cluster protein (TIGR04323 family)
MKLQLRGYIFSRPFLEERVPQHVQNIVIKNFCEQNNFQFLLSATEYAMKGSSYMLEKVLLDLNKVDGIVMYSMFQLPENKKYREAILSKIIKKKKQIFFACEKFSITKEHDIKRVENLWLIKKILPICYKYKKI